MTTNSIHQRLLEFDLSGDMIAAMTAIAAIKASVYGNGGPSDQDFNEFFETEIVRCLKGYDPEDPETKEALEEGVPETNMRHFAERDREMLIRQAEWIAFGLSKLKD